MKEQKHKNFQKKKTGDAQNRQNIKGAMNSKGPARDKLTYRTEDRDYGRNE